MHSPLKWICTKYVFPFSFFFKYQLSIPVHLLLSVLLKYSETTLSLPKATSVCLKCCKGQIWYSGKNFIWFDFLSAGQLGWLELAWFCVWLLPCHGRGLQHLLHIQPGGHQLRPVCNGLHIWNIKMYALNRFFAVTSPILYSQHRHNHTPAYVIILLCWSTSFAIGLPIMFGSNHRPENDHPVPIEVTWWLLKIQ